MTLALLQFLVLSVSLDQFFQPDTLKYFGFNYHGTLTLATLLGFGENRSPKHQESIILFKIMFVSVDMQVYTIHTLSYSVNC